MMRAVVVGAVGSTAILLEELAAAKGWHVPLLVTLPFEARGRHSDFVDLEPLARRAGADIHRTRKTNSDETLSAVREAAPDLIFVIGWSQLCGPDFLALAPDSVVGYHPAALPRLRGRAAIPWTILLDEPITAGSLFWMEEGTDDGDLLAQHFFHVGRDETAQTLYDRHMDALSAMLKECLPALARGERRRTVQDHRFATWAAKRTPADGLVDWTRSAVDIDRLVRAVGRPYPGAFTYSQGEKLVIWKSEVLIGDWRYHARPGQLVAREADMLVVATGEGLLKITDWDLGDAQLPGLHSIFRDSDARS